MSPAVDQSPATPRTGLPAGALPPLAGADTTRQRVLAALFAAAALALWLPGGYRELTPREQIGFGSLSAMLLALAALQLVLSQPDGHRGVTRWRLGPWFLLWSALTSGLAPLTWLLPQTGSATRIALSSVVAALTLFALSLIPWTIGYCAGPPRAATALARRGVGWLLRGTTTTIRGGAMPWALYGVGTLARLLKVLLSGRFGYVGDPSALVSRAGPFDHALTLLASFALFALAAAAYRAFSETTRGSKLTLWTLLSVEAVVGALAGGKQYFVLSLLAVLIPYCLLRGRFPVRIILIGALLFLWIAVPFNTAYRQVVRSEASTLSPAAAVAAAPQVLGTVAAAGSLPELVRDSSLQMLRRVRMLDSVAITMQLTPETIPYRNPAALASAPVVGLIPRAIWPSKPVLASGYEFSQQYYGTSRETYTSVSATPLGDLYRHGGLLTVVVGMLVLGAGARLFDTVLRAERDPRAICFLLVFLPMLLRADLYSMIVGIPSGLVLATVGARLMCRPAGRGKGLP